MSFPCSLFQASSEPQIKVLLLAYITLKVTLMLSWDFSCWRHCLKKGQISSSIHPQGSDTKQKYWQLARYRHPCWSNGPDCRSPTAWKYVLRNSTILLYLQLWKHSYRVSLVNSFSVSVRKITDMSYRQI